VHNIVRVIRGGVVLVNSRPASVVALTLAEAVFAWLASPDRAAADLGGTIADIRADDVYSSDVYEEGSAFVGDGIEEDTYPESTNEVRTAAAGRQTYHLASARAPAQAARQDPPPDYAEQDSVGRQAMFTQVSTESTGGLARPRRLSTGRQTFFQQQSVELVELEAAGLPARTVSTV